MCGIAGLMTIRREGPERAVLARMADALAHRGPDGRKDYLVGNAGLVHNRLAIVDVEGGAQPLFEPGGAALVADGRVYNDRDLRRELHGADFATGSDWEAALHLYRRDGADFVAKLRGMYALALHDPKSGHLVLARDLFGIKPLYYAETEHGLAFASEPHALIAGGFASPAIDAGPQSELLELQFTTRRETIFAGIKRVLPGETIVVADGKIVERHRRPALAEEGPSEWDEAEALERLEKALLDSIELHQRCDVPCGVLLSGGIDSSVLLAVMARVHARPVVALTAHFREAQAPDERARAAAVARAIGAEHIEVEVAAADFWSLLPQVAAAMDDPAADYACVPTFKLAARARAAGIKVLLSGEGGDELFAGYGRYRSIVRPWWMGGRAMRRKGIFDGLGVLRQRTVGWRDGIAAAEATERSFGRSRLQVAQATDCADWLPNDLLAKLDRCLMAHSVEGRAPFLDPAVAGVAFRLPDRLKIRERKGKWLLRRWLDGALPDADAFAAKRGFTVPVAEWIHAEGARLGPLVAAQPSIAELAEPAAVAKLFRDPRKHAGFAAWTLLFYALWHRRHIQGKAPSGDVFECLAAQ